MGKNRRIIAAVLVFAALGYLIAYTIATHPYFSSNDETQGVNGGATSSDTEQTASSHENQSDSAHQPLRHVDTLPAAPVPASENELTNRLPSEVQSTLTALSDPERLHGSLAGSLMVERDFDDLIRGLEKSSPESYERQARLLDIINRLDPVLDNSLRLRVLNCNDVFCGAAFNYDNADVVLEFMGALLATGTEAGAMAIQPIVIDDIPQLRMIIHRSASYQVD